MRILVNKNLLLPLVLILLVGCASSVPQIRRLPDDAVIVAFGNSLTQGVGTSAAQSYPAQLAELSGRVVVNAGVSGELSARGLSRLPAVLDKHEPHLLILCHGGNDILRKMDLNKMADNLRAMIREARSRGMDVVLISVPRPSLLMDGLDIYEDIATEFGIPVQTSIIADVLSNNLLKSDRIHPNADGYQAIARAVIELLQASGALAPGD